RYHGFAQLDDAVRQNPGPKVVMLVNVSHQRRHSTDDGAIDEDNGAGEYTAEDSQGKRHKAYLDVVSHQRAGIDCGLAIVNLVGNLARFPILDRLPKRAAAKARNYIDVVFGMGHDQV